MSSGEEGEEARGLLACSVATGALVALVSSDGCESQRFNTVPSWIWVNGLLR